MHATCCLAWLNVCHVSLKFKLCICLGLGHHVMWIGFNPNDELVGDLEIRHYVFASMQETMWWDRHSSRRKILEELEDNEIGMKAGYVGIARQVDRGTFPERRKLWEHWKGKGAMILDE